MFDVEKPKNEDKPKNEEIRAELSMWRGLAILLCIAIVAMAIVLIPHLFPHAVEAAKYCGDYPCKEAPEIALDGFDAVFSQYLECLKPFITIGFGIGFMSALGGYILRMLGGGK